MPDDWEAADDEDEFRKTNQALYDELEALTKQEAADANEAVEDAAEEKRDGEKPPWAAIADKKSAGRKQRAAARAARARARPARRREIAREIEWAPWELVLADCDTALAETMRKERDVLLHITDSLRRNTAAFGIIPADGEPYSFTGIGSETLHSEKFHTTLEKNFGIVTTYAQKMLAKARHSSQREALGSYIVLLREYHDLTTGYTEGSYATFDLGAGALYKRLGAVRSRYIVAATLEFRGLAAKHGAPAPEPTPAPASEPTPAPAPEPTPAPEPGPRHPTKLRSDAEVREACECGYDSYSDEDLPDMNRLQAAPAAAAMQKCLEKSSEHRLKDNIAYAHMTRYRRTLGTKDEHGIYVATPGKENELAWVQLRLWHLNRYKKEKKSVMQGRGEFLDKLLAKIQARGHRVTHSILTGGGVTGGQITGGQITNRQERQAGEGNGKRQCIRSAGTGT